MIRVWGFLVVIVPLAAWRMVWLQASLPDEGKSADAIARHLRAAEKQVGLTGPISLTGRPNASSDLTNAAVPIELEYRVLTNPQTPESTMTSGPSHAVPHIVSHATSHAANSDRMHQLSTAGRPDARLAALVKNLTRFGMAVTAVDRWDAEVPIWITAGRDGQPGWKGWDDNGDGVVDDTGELGAAWSDDRCVVSATLPEVKGPTRQLDHGAFVPWLPDGHQEPPKRVRLTLLPVAEPVGGSAASDPLDRAP